MVGIDACTLEHLRVEKGIRSLGQLRGAISPKRFLSPSSTADFFCCFSHPSRHHHDDDAGNHQSSTGLLRSLGRGAVVAGGWPAAPHESMARGVLLKHEPCRPLPPATRSVKIVQAAAPHEDMARGASLPRPPCRVSHQPGARAPLPRSSSSPPPNRGCLFSAGAGARLPLIRSALGRRHDVARRAAEPVGADLGAPPPPHTRAPTAAISLPAGRASPSSVPQLLLSRGSGAQLATSCGGLQARVFFVGETNLRGIPICGTHPTPSNAYILSKILNAPNANI